MHACICFTFGLMRTSACLFEFRSYTVAKEKHNFEITCANATLVIERYTTCHFAI